MRHRVRGRHLGRTPSHRKAMFRNMAVSLIRSARPDEDDPGAPKVSGRITTTVAKAKELRPFVEKLITMARKSLPIQREADQYATSAERNSEEWRRWRNSEEWQKWNQTQAPVLALRRRAFSMLRDNEAVDILFDELAEKFEDRPGGYTRIIRLDKFRLGDAGQEALIEFVGENDRVSTKGAAAPVVVDDEEDEKSPAGGEEEGSTGTEAGEEAEAATDEEGTATATAEEEPAEDEAEDKKE